MRPPKAEASLGKYVGKFPGKCFLNKINVKWSKIELQKIDFHAVDAFTTVCCDRDL